MCKYDLERFLKAQETAYQRALAEMKRGRKQTHWMWFIFPQLRELGRSQTAKYYGIADLEEARAYLQHPILGVRLREISSALLFVPCNDPFRVMGEVDDMKLCSSMTLFANATEDNDVFLAVLDKFYGGVQDSMTLSILKREN